MNAALSSLIGTVSINITGRRVVELPPEVIADIHQIADESEGSAALGRVAQRVRIFMTRTKPEAPVAAPPKSDPYRCTMKEQLKDASGFGAYCD